MLKYFHHARPTTLNSVGDCPEDTTLHTNFQSEWGMHMHPPAPPAYGPDAKPQQKVTQSQFWANYIEQMLSRIVVLIILQH